MGLDFGVIALLIAAVAVAGIVVKWLLHNRKVAAFTAFAADRGWH